MISNNEFGKVTLQDEAIKDIVKIIVDKKSEIVPTKNGNGFITVANKNDELILNLKIKIKQGSDIAKQCTDIQNEIHETILSMSSLDIKNINLDIEGFML